LLARATFREVGLVSIRERSQNRSSEECVVVQALVIKLISLRPGKRVDQHQKTENFSKCLENSKSQVVRDSAGEGSPTFTRAHALSEPAHSLMAI
jgi:hypothetical protein